MQLVYGEIVATDCGFLKQFQGLPQINSRAAYHNRRGTVGNMALQREIGSLRTEGCVCLLKTNLPPEGSEPLRLNKLSYALADP